MGYNLYIGEAEPCINLEDRYACIHVNALELPESPLNSTDVHTNYCWPSYTGWANFCEDFGLSDVFYAGSHGRGWWKDDQGKEHDGLIIRHPGAVELLPCHLKAFQHARERFYVKDATSDKDVYNNRRIDWLCWWTDWALKNCKYPTFYNS